MAVYDILPENNLRAEDIRDTLLANGADWSNVEGNKSANYLPNYFNKWAKINPFAKFKPIADARQLIDYEKDKEWWKGGNGNCGLDIKILGDINLIPNEYADGVAKWEYIDILSYTNKFPLRLADFVGYKWNAKAPLVDFNSQDYASTANLDAQIRTSVLVEDFNDYELRLKDINDFASWYFGAMIIDGNITRWATAQYNISNYGADAYIGVYGLREGIYDVYPFLCSKQKVGNEDPAGASFVALPNIGKQTTRLFATAFTLNIIATYKGGKVNWELLIENRFSSQLTLENNYFAIRNKGNDINDPMESGEMEYPTGNIVVEPLSTRRVSGSYTFGRQALDMNFWFVSYTEDMVKMTPILDGDFGQQ